jgi:hypothetical protein
VGDLVGVAGVQLGNRAVMATLTVRRTEARTRGTTHASALCLLVALVLVELSLTFPRLGLWVILGVRLPAPSGDRR